MIVRAPQGSHVRIVSLIKIIDGSVTIERIDTRLSVQPQDAGI